MDFYLARMSKDAEAERPQWRHDLQVHVGDAKLPGTWGRASQSPCFIIMMEVLDNCPHDKVVRQGPNDSWQQVSVAQSPHGRFAEVLQPLTDGLISECLHAASWKPSPRPWWRTRLDSLVGGTPGSWPRPQAAAFVTPTLQLFSSPVLPFRTACAAMKRPSMLQAHIAHVTQSAVRACVARLHHMCLSTTRTMESVCEWVCVCVQMQR